MTRSGGAHSVKICHAFAALAVSTSLIVSFAAGAQDAKKAKHKPAAEEPAAAPVKTPAAEPAAKSKIVRTETLTYDNWTVNCAYTDQADAKPQCSAILRVAEKVNNVPRVVFTWIIGQQQSKPVSVISMMTGVLIANGVDVVIGDAPVQKYTYSLCAPDHCEAIIALDAPVVAQLKRATTVEATIVRIGGQSLKYTVETKGFEQALAAVTK